MITEPTTTPGGIPLTAPTSPQSKTNESMAPGAARANDGTPILDTTPRNQAGNIDIDVYFRDTMTGTTAVVRSPYGNTRRVPVLVGPDWREENHDVFDPFWWAEGDASCDCNRGPDAEFGVRPCGGGGKRRGHRQDHAGWEVGRGTLLGCGARPMTDLERLHPAEHVLG